MNTQIVLALRDLGIPANLLGYEYLKTGISLCMKDPSYANSMTKRLYPDIARAHNTTSYRAERAIRHAIEIAWDRGDPEAMERYFGWTISKKAGKPTNGEFIATVAEQIRMEQDSEDCDQEAEDK